MRPRLRGHRAQARGDTRRAIFFREWIKAPLRVAAIAPSSQGLAKAITDGLTGADAPIIELGPGTGVFTAALLARGIAPADIVAIEASPGFAGALAARFPAVKVVCDDAARVKHLTPFGAGAAGAAVCGLPLLSMPPRQVMRILEGSFASMHPASGFRLFTYGPRCPVRQSILERLDLEAERTAFVLFNAPPASVYILRKRTSAR